jgi:AcrR family transcriptional regulator
MPEQQRVRGRRAGGDGARETIVGAARTEFAERGYDATSVRGVARRAEVDPALVRYYFPGGKPEIFARVLTQRSVDPVVVVAGVVGPGLADMGHRLIRTVVETWDGEGGPEGFRLAFAAMGAGRQGELVRDFLSREIFSSIARTMSGPDVGLRVNLVAAHVVGVLVARYVLRAEPLASRSPQEIADVVGPALQRYLEGAADGT